VSHLGEGLAGSLVFLIRNNSFAVLPVFSMANSNPKSEFDPSFDTGEVGGIRSISMATALGACSGFAAKRLAKGAGLGIGLGFMAVQGLAQTGLIKINWPRVEELFHAGLDLVYKYLAN
jgi:hypothetical protein